MKSFMLVPLLALLGTQDPAADLKVGDKAPVFETMDDTGHPWKSEDVVGKRIVVFYFYPASFTGSCTDQALAYQKDAEKLIDKDAVVIGISGDRVPTQTAFKKFHKLGFALIADEKGAVGRLFGVPAGKGGKVKWEIDGKIAEFARDVTLDRWTFVVGLDGKIIYKNTKVDPPRDSKAVLDVIAKLQ
jgi:peroxiredoxin Q/BCP